MAKIIVGEEDAVIAIINSIQYSTHNFSGVKVDFEQWTAFEFENQQTVDVPLLGGKIPTSNAIYSFAQSQTPLGGSIIDTVAKYSYFVTDDYEVANMVTSITNPEFQILDVEEHYAGGATFHMSEHEFRFPFKITYIDVNTDLVYTTIVHDPKFVDSLPQLIEEKFWGAYIIREALNRNDPDIVNLIKLLARNKLLVINPGVKKSDQELQERNIQAVSDLMRRRINREANQMFNHPFSRLQTIFHPTNTFD